MHGLWFAHPTARPTYALTSVSPPVHDSYECDPCFTDKGAGQFGGGFPLAAKDLIGRMLTKRPHERIGIPEVRMHPFFHGFDWAAFHANRMPPPFVPARDPRSFIQFGDELLTVMG